MKLTLREALAGAEVDTDNLSIVLCTYFSRHANRPEDDEENEDNHYWGDWVIQKCDEALDKIADAAEKRTT